MPVKGRKRNYKRRGKGRRTLVKWNNYNKVRMRYRKGLALTISASNSFGLLISPHCFQPHIFNSVAGINIDEILEHQLKQYDLYRTTGIKISYTPQSNASELFGPQAPMLFIGQDVDNAGFPANIGDVLTRDDVFKKSSQKPWTIYFKIAPMAQANGNEKSFVQLKKNLLGFNNLQNQSVHTQGCIWMVASGPWSSGGVQHGAGQLFGNLVVTTYVEFMHRQYNVTSSLDLGQNDGTETISALAVGPDQLGTNFYAGSPIL